MKENFDSAVNFVLVRETVFEKGHHGDWDKAISTNHSKDKGGLTKFGIDQRSHPKVNIESLTVESAKEIYRKEYWKGIKGDELPNHFDLAAFDIAVNNGVHTAGQLLQKCLGRLYLGQIDGIIGPRTIQAAKKATRENLVYLIHLRQQHYDKIVRNNPSQKVFADGWRNRNNALKVAIGIV